jgi:hypothetical protein
MKVFITYGDAKYQQSKERLIRQTEHTHIFDQVISYDRSDISAAVLDSELMKYNKGGGLWSWKPDIILKTLDAAEYGDIIVYADSGCTVNATGEWVKYFNLLSKHEVLAFYLNCTNQEYCKKDILEFFRKNTSHWEKNYHISATVIILKKTVESLNLIREWRSIMLEHSNLVLDVNPIDIGGEAAGFKGNRHDQSLYSALVYKYYGVHKIKILQNHFEGRHHKIFNQAIIATRIADRLSRSSEYKPFHISMVHHFLMRPIRYCLFRLRLKSKNGA